MRRALLASAPWLSWLAFGCCQTSNPGESSLLPGRTESPDDPCRPGLVLGHKQDYSPFEFGDEDELAVKAFPIRLQPPDVGVAPRYLRIHGRD